MTRSNPICVALDTDDLEKAKSLARSLAPYVGYLKIGMEFFYAFGARGYEAVAASGVPVFLDLKLHDIPNTVARAIASLMRLEPRPAITNVHATGGFDMMRAAADASHGRTKLIAVAVLTSLSNADIWSAGFDGTKDTVAHAIGLAALAKKAGLSGVVCSPHDLTGIRAATGGDFLTVVPGIRPVGSSTQDQKRIATPQAALDAGADILVIGRAITGESDPAHAAAMILDGLKNG